MRNLDWENGQRVCLGASRRGVGPDYIKVNTSKDGTETEVAPTSNLCYPDGPKGSQQTDIRNLDWMDPRPKLSPPQTCGALIDPREPYKLTSGTWTDPREPDKLTSATWTGKMAKVCAQGSLALGWHLIAKNPYIEGWTPGKILPTSYLCCPDSPKGVGPGPGLGPDCKKSIHRRMDLRRNVVPTSNLCCHDRPKGTLQTDISNLDWVKGQRMCPGAPALGWNLTAKKIVISKDGPQTEVAPTSKFCCPERPKGAIETDNRNLNCHVFFPGENGQSMFLGASGRGLGPDCINVNTFKDGAQTEVVPTSNLENGQRMCLGASGRGVVHDCIKVSTSKDGTETEVVPTSNLCCPDRPKEALQTDIRNLYWENDQSMCPGALALGWDLTAKSQYIEEWTPDRSCPHIRLVLPRQSEGSPKTDNRNLDWENGQRMCLGASGRGVEPDCINVNTSKDGTETEVVPTSNLCCPGRPKETLQTDIRNLDWENDQSMCPGALALCWDLTAKSQYIEEWTPDRSCPPIKLVLPRQSEGSPKTDNRNLD
ncbi:hypothetical protein RLOC_00008093 [Lonchura striata]|uniref:Uncharacterized protein n=1 Tax=Lonchura striata TaxID=40157 RepID=A0A218U965_9PASE|nr:hypothetical protein RLOC_00008093 [Lonchura striata domestica]